MAAQSKKHHYIPQFLLKRFAIEEAGSKKDAYRLYQIGRDGRALLQRTSNVAASNYFHGPAENGLESSLAEIEGRFAKMLVALDAGELPSHHSAAISRFVWLQAIRTRAMRQNFTDAGKVMMTRFMEGFRDGRGLEAIAKTVDEDFEGLFVKAISDRPDAKTRQQRRAFKKKFRKEVAKPGRRDALVAALKENTRVTIPTIADQFSQHFIDNGGIAKAVDEGHIKALQGLVSSDKIPDKLQDVAWSLIAFNDQGLLIGDCGAFSIFSDGDTKPTLSGREDWSALICPISRSQALIGKRGDYTFDLTTIEVNSASAKCSTEYIYSSSQDEKTLSLVPFIGTGAWLSKEPGFDDMIDEVLESSLGA